MPELPEVETLKLGLQKYIVGKTIVDVEVIDRSLLEGDETLVIGAEIKDVRRYGKGIVIDTNNGYSIAVHIKLTGQLIFRDEKTRNLPVAKPTPSTVPNKFTRVVFKLGNFSTSSKNKNEEFLFFQEVRGFAWMKILPTNELKTLSFFKTLGPEPLPSPGSGTDKLTEELFQKIVQKSNLPIKVLLMDQTKIGGIGNIYANDACFDAEIDPRRRAKTLTEKEIQRLYHSILKVLETGMKYRGSSELNYVDVLGNTGEYQHHALVYGKKGKPCARCGATVTKIYLGGRGTFFCENCQK